MSFRTEKYDNYTVITFSTDKLDAVVAPDLKSELVLLNKNGERNILLDMSSINYCDSSGLSALLIGYRMCGQVNGSFIISSIQPSVKKLITISQLDTIIKSAENIVEAIDLLYEDELERNLGTEQSDD
ncbi:MAG: STAS domain-containing protein [Vicingus serpentipes]|nr:STAS domain-containing protein [Vicingus serpentipes]